MIARNRDAGSFDFEATLRGSLWGFLLMAAFAVFVAVIAPLYPALEQFYYLNDEPIRWTIWGLASFVAGLVAGRRAGTLGLLHGALAAIGAFVLLAIVSAILSGTPNIWHFGLRVLVSVVVGGLGGIIGANMAEE